MEDSDNIYSERTLRYGRNINFISFIALAMIIMDVDLSGANLFGAKTSEQNIWRVLLILIGYHFVTFQYIGWIDWKNWIRGLSIMQAGFSQPQPTTRLKISGNRTKIYHWSLFINKELVAKDFLDKGHKAVTLYDDVTETAYGWVITHDDESIPFDGGAFAVNKEFFEKYRSNYWRWLFFEIGLPTVIGLFALGMLVGKMACI